MTDAELIEAIRAVVRSEIRGYFAEIEAKKEAQQREKLLLQRIQRDEKSRRVMDVYGE